MIRKEKRIQLWIGWTWLNFKLIPLPILKLWFVSLVELIALTRKISFHISAFKKLILWWNSRKFKPKLTLYGMCFELTLYNDADFLALGPMMRSYLKVRSIFRSREIVRSWLTSYQTVTSNVLGLVVSANLSDTTYGWHGYVTGMSLYYYHWSQIPMERQQLMLTSDMVLATSLGMRKTALLGNPYTPCSRSETHYQCDLQ